MSEPRHEFWAGIHRLTWEDLGVTMRVDRLREDSRMAVTAEVLIRIPDMPNMRIHHKRMTLTSTRSSTEVVRACKERVNTLDWAGLIDDMCDLVLTKYRQGEQPVDLAELPKRERLAYRVRPLLVEGQPNLIYGDGGLGKSMLGMYLGIITSLGYPHNGLEPEPGNVLYLDYEADAETSRDRHELLCAGVEAGKPSVHYRLCNQALQDDIEQIHRIVVERQINLIIIDSAGPACGGKPELSENVIPYFTALRSIRTHLSPVTSLTIAHETKARQTRGPYGNAYWWNLSRTVFRIKKAQEPDTDTIEVGLWHEKANYGRHLKPMGLRLSFGEESIQVRRIDLTDSDLAENLSLAERITGVLYRGPKSITQITEELGLDVERHAATVRTTVNRRKSLFVPLGNGTYGLLQSPQNTSV